ncbi:MAG: FAD-binding oxidoreductase [Thermaerobacter sp.]|nr:FAD-binding oxidoreductase [Thermaerobacter sp.]
MLSKQLVTPVVAELRLYPCTESMSYQAGQYALLCDASHAMPQRSYSIANTPRSDGLVSMLVTRVPNGATSGWVHDRLQPGEDVALSGPYGTFLIDPAAPTPLLLLAGGSGLAPARALAEAALSAQPGRSVTLFVSARTAADVISRDWFERWSGAYAGFRYLLTLTRDTAAPLHGRVPTLLPDLFSQLDDHEIFVSGAPGFVTACAEAVRTLGAKATKVHTEPFFVEPQPWLGRPPEHSPV